MKNIFFIFQVNTIFNNQLSKAYFNNMNSITEYVTNKYNWFIHKSGIHKKDYQLFGVQWCVKREMSQLYKGGFIADEMGLGKTIMMIATFIVNFMPCTLIVLPNVLLEQWQSEIFRTTGHHVLIYHGKNKKNITIQQLQSATIVLTTYNTIAVKSPKKNKEYHPILTLLHKVTWDRVVFDEAHHLRNKNSRYFGAKLLNTNIRWLISGTPIQNKSTDFFNLCNVLGLPASYYANDTNMDHLVRNFVLKRSKKQVGISIPSINFDNENVSWKNDDERKMSNDIHSAIMKPSLSPKLYLFLKARQICILPALLKNNIDRLKQNNVIHSNHSAALTSSSKMDAVIKTILANQNNGNGKLVFCHFKQEIDIIVSRLRDNGMTNVTTFDGRTSQINRSRRLKENYEVIVHQIQTGCEGLNLQDKFSEIYFVSPHWNPAIEEQAVARCHRIGQLKHVHVFRFSMDDFLTIDHSPSQYTLDNYISRVQVNKRDISKHILHG